VAKKRVGHHEALLERVRLEPDITLSELQGWLLKTFGVSSSLGGLWNTLNKLGLSFKNMPCLPNGRGLMLDKRASLGRNASPALIRHNEYLLTKPALQPIWHVATGAVHALSVW
jgi:hypothetical protein